MDRPLIKYGQGFVNTSKGMMIVVMLGAERYEQKNISYPIGFNPSSARFNLCAYGPRAGGNYV